MGSFFKKALCFVSLIFIFSFTVSAQSDVCCDVSDMLSFGGKLLTADEGTYYTDPNYSGVLFFQQGTDSQPLLEESVSCLNIRDGELFFVIKGEEGDSIHKMNTSTLEVSPVSEEYGFEIKHMYVMSDGDIYFSNSDSIMLLPYGQKNAQVVFTAENLISFAPVADGFVTAQGDSEKFSLYLNGTVICEDAVSYTVKNGSVAFTQQNGEYAVDVTDVLSGTVEAYEYKGIATVEVDDIVSENMAGDTGADASEYADGISLFAVNEPVKNRKELSKGVENMLKKAEQLCKINWTPLKDIYGWNKEYTYKAGQTYSGLPYGQPVFAKYVPWSASFSEFLAAVNDPTSLMYTKYSYNNELAPYYSIDCSAFISWVWQLSERYTTVGIPGKANLISKTSIAEAKVGDCICKAKVHVVLISDITYNEKNEINSITITEASPKKETDFCCQSTSYGEGFELTIADFMQKYFADGYSLYRNPKADEITYKHSCEVILDSDTCNVCNVGQISGTVKPFSTTVKVTANYVTAYQRLSDRSTVAAIYQKNKSLKIVGYGKNALGEVWYKLNDGSWINGKGVKYTSLSATAKIDGLSLPSGNIEFAADPHIKGTVKSGNNIAAIKAEVFSGGDYYTAAIACAQTGKTADGFVLEESKLDKLIDFSTLTPGQYRVVLTVDEYSYSPFIKENVTSQKSFTSDFTVLDDPRCTSWSTTYPALCDSQFVEKEKRYAYSDLVTIVSDKPSLEGYTLASSKWLTDDKGTLNGVSSWPDGFDKSHSLYTEYDLSSLKSFKSETQKTTVTEGSTVGYIYYHWCENTSTSGPANKTINKTKTSAYKAFHAFYSTKKPSEFKQIGACYQYSNSGCCKHSYWYYAISVKSVSFTKQSKEFTYTRWTPWSVWSQTPFEKSDTRKTKSATVYRYNDKEHIWDEGVVTALATCTENGMSVHNCSHCEKVKNQPLAAKGHSYAKDYTVDAQATASKAGSESRHCKVCGVITDKKDIAKISRFEASFKTKVYNGKKQTPKITVYDSKGKKLTDKKDYTVKFSDGSTDSGKYVATITFKGRYKGTKKINYTITPRSPQKLKFTSSTTSVKLTWSKAKEATGYKVFVYDTKAREYKQLKATTATSYTHKNLNNGAKYTYIVKAYKKIGDQYIYSTSSKIVTATKPLTTTISSLKSTSKGKVTVGWKNVSGENGFQIFYSTKKDSGFKKLTNCKANSTKLTKGTFKSGTKYYFRVRAYKNAGDGYVYSAFSGVKSIKIK